MTQKQMVLNHIQTYGSITTWEAIKEYGITRLSDRIFTLKNDNWEIVTEWEYGTNRFGKRVKWKKYKLAKKRKITLEDIQKFFGGKKK